MGEPARGVEELMDGYGCSDDDGAPSLVGEAS